MAFATQPSEGAFAGVWPAGEHADARGEDQRRANHDKVTAPELVKVEYNGQVVVVPRRIAKALPYLTERELENLGVEL